MRKYFLLSLLAGIIVGTLLISSHVHASSVEKVAWCHCEPNGNCETLSLPLAALIQAGHVNANGNPLHAGDHAGECVVPTSTPTPTLKPTCTPTPTQTTSPTPTPTEVVNPTPTPNCQEDEDCAVPTPTPTEIVTPTPTDVPQQSSSNSDNGPSAPEVCQGQTILFAPTITVWKRLSPTDVHFEWTTVADWVHDYVVQYGTADGVWSWTTVAHGESVDLHFLPANANIWTRVAGLDCVQGPFSMSVDP